MNTLVGFSLTVGIGSTLLLDLWSFLLYKVGGITPTNWGIVGRWLWGLRQGQWVAIQSAYPPITLVEKVSGWLFHYWVGVVYAVLLALVWGDSFIGSPTLLPTFYSGFLVSSLAGLTLFMPAMGAGFCGRKIPNQAKALCLMLIAHSLFALGQYIFALVYARS